VRYNGKGAPAGDLTFQLFGSVCYSCLGHSFIFYYNAKALDLSDAQSVII
jgi:hypothetical protein